MMKNVLLLALIISAATLIYIGVSEDILAPVLTGLGFAVIAYLFWQQPNQRRY